MSNLDWIVLFVTISFIVFYGIWKTRKERSLDSYLRSNNQMKWWAVGLSIMGTQASAVTFLSVPGQGFEDGLRFVQFYLGLPIAMIIISITVVPIYAKLKVYTAYEYLETRFDLKTRTLASTLFLLQRGLGTGITIYAPAIVLSTILGWNVNVTIVFIGGLVILYTVSGGSTAVGVTQNIQMFVITTGMFAAGYLIVHYMPAEIGFVDAVNIAGNLGKMNAIDFNFDWDNRYNFWSGMTGGLFLALSYFGTDQSQVGRYLGGATVTQSRLGLLFNGLLKIPMQFLILLLGVLLYVFYLFYTPPVFFNKVVVDDLKKTQYYNQYLTVDKEYKSISEQKKHFVNELHQGIVNDDEQKIEESKTILSALNLKSESLRMESKKIITLANPNADTSDSDYIFISFVLSRLPIGFVGLLLAVIFCAAMSSMSAGLNSLAATTTIDIYKRMVNANQTDVSYVTVTKIFTIIWGLACIGFAFLASMVDNLIQAVNILGSLFYGTILGIFLAAFYFKYITSRSIFWGAIVAEIAILLLYFYSSIAYLWYNVIGCLLVLLIAFMLQFFTNKKSSI